MHQLELEPNVTMYVSDDMFVDYGGNKSLIQETLEGLFGNLSNEEHQYIGLYGKVNNRERMACLHAHGDSESGVWYYQDGTEQKLVQDWINSLKGRYSMVVLFVCNPGAHTPVCKKSLLLLSDADLSILGARAGACNLNLIHPTEGELEYTLGYELEQLRKKMKRTKAKTH